ncbi:MAG TPA: hypothetical protein VGM92_03700 [Candidatus Kapabacteria bacterium]
MRNYTDREVRALLNESNRATASLFESGAEYLETSDLFGEEYGMYEDHSERATVQFIADLEFESKFQALLRSIALRWPAIGPLNVCR